MIRKMIRGAGYLVTMMMILLLVVSLVVLFMAKMNPGQVPSLFGFRTLSVLSGSMRPAIQPGDAILVRDCDLENIQVGDVITYRLDSSTLVTHRVTAILRQGGSLLLKTKGDANPSEDENLIFREQLVGKMVHRLPYGGYAAKFARGPLGLVVLVVIPAVLMMIGYMQDMVKERRRMKRERLKKRVV